VLVVEDDESTALFVTRVLSRNGFEAAWVPDAEQASERLEAEDFDVLLADYRLPGRSGMDLARDARLARPDLGIAVMTSFAEGHTEMAARCSGADDFFEKPLHLANFVCRIRELVTRSRAPRLRADHQVEQGGGEQEAQSPQDASSGTDASGGAKIAGSGPEERAVMRDSAFAQLDVAVADGAAQPRREGTEDDLRARFSALSPDGELDDPGCEGWRDATLRGEVGQQDRDLLAQVAHPALSYLVAQRLAALRRLEPIFIWASGAPVVSIGSNAARVMAPITRPGWSLGG
jgi:CheY-like chemotaxis protein